MASDLNSTVVAELEAAYRWRTAFFVTQRPWLDLYGVRVNPVAAFGSVSNKPSHDPALIHRVLPDELLHENLSNYVILIVEFISSLDSGLPCFTKRENHGLHEVSEKQPLLFFRWFAE